ncbi:MAG: aminotransferase class V-fold PLP-dependent enzyme [Ignavibacteria bacterium]|nr:aminotransferase class V-fold PLP-dependent enzyme [Ignavibacteria bacterium]
MTRKTHTGLTLQDLRNDVIGIDTMVPLLDGSERSYVFLDNGASTPTFGKVMDCIRSFLPWYSGVHRGTGFKSVVATEIFDRTHEVVARFVGADVKRNMVVFTKNTTECVNKLSNRWGFGPADVVITTGMEHHSNDLPWRKNAKVVHVGIMPDGSLDLEGLQDAIRRHKGNLRVVAVSGASNITGICQPIHRIAEWAHEADAAIFVDAAQLAPHRRIDMRPDDDPGHIDFLALSAHKMYAPFGIGVLVGPIDFFEQGEPDMVGGGVVDVVTLDEVIWKHAPHKDEAGSPNVVGAVALAESIAILESVGMETIREHERALLEYACTRLRKIEGVTLYGPTSDFAGRVGVIPFTVDGMHHALVAAILSAEGGIGVRNGFFCAQPYVKKLLGISKEQELDAGCGVGDGDRSGTPGMVRASLGCYSNEADLDAFIAMVDRIVRGDYKGTYRQDPVSGSFLPEGFEPDLSKYFPFFDSVVPAKNRTYSEAS